MIETLSREIAPSLEKLSVKLFADGADIDGIRKLAANPNVKGFTTNPTLMAKAGIADYERFSRSVLDEIGNRPISFEVFADDAAEMERQAARIASWGSNVYVKIPVTNTQGVSMNPLAQRLSAKGVKLNVTALMTLDQVEQTARVLADGVPACISVFAGRVADTGRDPLPIMRDAVELLRPTPSIELIWASPRELLNIFHADSIGCHIITVTHDVLGKLNLVGRNLLDYSLDTVQMFYNDAKKSGFTL